MSSSGLIYAVIVGAWAAYLVPMWLRRQDELNEARPTERFSTAIRLLSGRAGMERRYAKELQDRTAGEAEPDEAAPDAATDPESSVDVRSFAAPPAEKQKQRQRKEPRPAPHQTSGSAAERARRTKALARRRRTTVLLFAAFSLGAIVAAVGGLRFLWAPGIPAALLSTYIVHLRTQERRRFAFTMDRRRAEAAAQRLRESRRPQPRAEEPQPEPAPSVSPQEAGRRALVEQTDHAEWVDQQRERGRAPQGDSWEPVPVPLPTYVTAPVAPRAPGNAELAAPDTWSASRSSSSDPDPAPRQRTARRARERGRTPLFDQYEDGERPRAANE
ncbi:divisome protein SepX/GlpR [Streptomyces sp. NBC_01465]|uniref:divisome protein SepX/GlpR n=1 Tax=Streptomyces sp. NBC_01465 TaxID=2903878 RepID=UPI002E36EFB7|nr:gephyrin-like molybdotransferase receptor GlpR [Streptomyces sp. NBC_01465]